MCSMRDDVDLPVPGVELDSGGHPLTVLALLEEMKEERNRQKTEIEHAEWRERMVLGEQWPARDQLAEGVLPAGDAYDDTLITENLLYPNVLTWAARVNQGRIDPRAFPFQPTQEDREAASALNTILD